VPFEQKGMVLDFDPHYDRHAFRRLFFGKVDGAESGGVQ
jgi:hypothetical protein